MPLSARITARNAAPAALTAAAMLPCLQRRYLTLCASASACGGSGIFAAHALFAAATSHNHDTVSRKRGRRATPRQTLPFLPPRIAMPHHLLLLPALHLVRACSNNRHRKLRHRVVVRTDHHLTTTWRQHIDHHLLPPPAPAPATAHYHAPPRLHCLPATTAALPATTCHAHLPACHCTHYCTPRTCKFHTGGSLAAACCMVTIVFRRPTCSADTVNQLYRLRAEDMVAVVPPSGSRAFATCITSICRARNTYAISSSLSLKTTWRGSSGQQ